MRRTTTFEPRRDFSLNSGMRSIVSASRDARRLCLAAINRRGRDDWPHVAQPLLHHEPQGAWQRPLTHSAGCTQLPVAGMHCMTASSTGYCVYRAHYVRWLLDSPSGLGARSSSRHALRRALRGAWHGAHAHTTADERRHSLTAHQRRSPARGLPASCATRRCQLASRVTGGNGVTSRDRPDA